MIEQSSSFGILERAYQQGQKPPIRMDLDDWADKYRGLNEISGERWHTNTQEIARGAMKAVTESGVRIITVMCATQIMKTELILNIIGYFVHLDPCPILVVQPKEEMAKKFSHVRLKQMIRSTPVIRELFSEEKSRDASNTTTHKEFHGGHIAIVSAKSPSNLAMFAIRVVLSDEIDKYDADSGKEGDPLSLAEERQSKYSTNSLAVRCCSPTVKDLSRIEASYEESDMRKPFVACPHCQHKQVLEWKQVKWDKDSDGHHLPETAQYYCNACGAGWNEYQRLQTLKKIYWRQTKQFQCKICTHDNYPASWNPDEDERWDEAGRAICEECKKGKCPNHHAGFWASKLYGTFRPMSDMVNLWIQSQGNIERLKTFINTQLAQSFESQGDQIKDLQWLLDRKEKYTGELPHGVGVITAGIDVQENRIECETVGWGVGEESWSLDYKVIAGDPKDPATWQELDKHLQKPYIRNDGKHSFIAAACIDIGGHHTQYTLGYCKHRMARRVWPVRGIGGDGRPHPVWPQIHSKGKYNVPFYNIGVDSAKNVVFGRLFIEQEGAGYCHFPDDRHDDWFKQLTAEKRITKYRGASKILVWDNPRKARNEAFDCRVYAYAALCGLQNKGWNINQLTVDQKLILLSTKDKEKVRQDIPLKQNQNRIKSNKGIVRSPFMDR